MRLTRPMCARAFSLRVEDAIEVTHAAGGIAVLAHPGCYTRVRDVDDAVRRMKEAGLDGLEMNYTYAQNRGHFGESAAEVAALVAHFGALADEVGAAANRRQRLSWHLETGNFAGASRVDDGRMGAFGGADGMGATSMAQLIPERPTWIEINRGALANNVRQLRNLLTPSCLLSGVVKANAYGHGAVAVAHILVEAGVDRLAVATLGEALELRTGGIVRQFLSWVTHPALWPRAP